MHKEDEMLEELARSLSAKAVPPFSSDLESRISKSIRQEKAPSGIVRVLSANAGTLLAAASVAAIINIAFLFYTAKEEQAPNDAASLFIDSYRLDELNNNL
jgi:hypothetical protein